MNRSLCTSLRLVYEVNGRYEAAYISEFFKFCGILVTEQDISNIADYKKMAEDCRVYDRVLLMGAEVEAFEESEKFIKCFYSPSFEIDCQNDIFRALYQELFSIVSEVLKNNSSALSDLVSIYVKKNYCRLSYIKRYFSGNITDTEKEKLYRSFLDIISDLNDHVKMDRDIFPYVSYAKVLCAKKVNDLCNSLQLNYYFRPERMIDRCFDIVNHIGEFPGAYALAAAFCSCETSFRTSVIPFYEKALDKDRDHPAMISVYYKLGQYYEKVRNDGENAYSVYEKAFSMAPESLRLLFKKGSHFLDERKYQSAINTYKKIIKILDRKRRNHQLFPVEYEYICKCYLLIGLIYDFYWSDELQGSMYYRKAISLVEKELEDSRFFRVFLGDENGIFMKYLETNISLREHILVEKYR